MGNPFVCMQNQKAPWHRLETRGSENVFENSAVWTLESSEEKLASGFGLLDAGNMGLDEVLPNPRVEVVCPSAVSCISEDSVHVASWPDTCVWMVHKGLLEKVIEPIILGASHADANEDATNFRWVSDYDVGLRTSTPCLIDPILRHFG